MAPIGFVERLGAARSRLEQACGWLLSPSPDTLDRCSGILESAASELDGNLAALSLARGDPEALAECWRLRRAVRRAGALLENAAAYHREWDRMLGGMADGYVRGGEPAAVLRPGHIDLRA
jgi:hypothetical protein